MAGLYGGNAGLYGGNAGLYGGNPGLYGGAAGLVNGGGVVGPVLTNAVDTATGTTTATISVDTNTGNGTLYWYVSTSATPPSAANLKSGSGSAAFGNQAVSGTGTQSASPTGLAPDIQYYAYFIQTSTAPADSNIAAANGFLTWVTRAFANPNRVPGWNVSGLSNGTDTGQMSRKAYRNEQSFAVGGANAPIQIGYAGRYQATNATETDNPNAVAVTAWLEYPAGTYLQCTISGVATSGNTPVGGGTFLLFDAMTLVTAVPAGAWFFVWTYAAVTATQRWAMSYSSTTSPAALGDKVERGVAGLLTNMTPNTGMATGSGSMMAPTIVRTTCAGLSNVLTTFGDSLVSINDNGTGDPSGNLAYMGRACSGQIPMLHCSASGTTLFSVFGNGGSPLTTTTTMRRAWMEACGCTDVYSNYGINDLISGTNLANMQQMMKNEVALFLMVPTVLRTYVGTIQTNCATAVPADCETAPTQTVLASPAGQFGPTVSTSVRVQLDTWLRGGGVIPGLTALWDVTTAIEVDHVGALTQDGGYWITGQENPGTHLGSTGTGRRATQDGLHPIVTNYATEQGGLWIMRDAAIPWVAAVKAA